MWQPDALLEQLYEETVERHRTQAETESRSERRERLRGVLKKAIGSFDRVEGAIGAELLESVDCGTYTRERVRLSAVEGVQFAAYVLIPKGIKKPMPAVLAIHGHGYGSREIVGLLPDGTQDEGVPTCHNHFALPLVERGLIVLAPDVAGFGERRLAEDMGKDPMASSSCYKLATHLLMYGKTLTGFRTAELLGALDYLVSRSDVDADAVGTMGFSGGALLAWVCATLDERLRSVLLTGFPGTFKGTIMEVFHCVDNYTPGLLAEAELPEWIGLIAPRPLFVESGCEDPIFPLESSREAISRLTSTYREADASERFASDIFSGAHEVSGRVSYDWLANQLFS